MILRSVLAFSAELLLGLALVLWLIPGGLGQDFWLKVFVGIGAGLGIGACIYFFWLAVFGPGDRLLTIAELALAAGFLALALRKNRVEFSFKKLLRLPHLQLHWTTAVLGVMVLALLIVSLRNFYILTFTSPFGDFDAYAIWNLHARFIFRNPAQWTMAFSNQLAWYFHPDYPLLVSLNVAHGWFDLGQENQRVPIVQAGLFTFSLAGVLAFGLRKMRSTGQAMLGALILLATPRVISMGAAEVADIPLAYYILACCTCLYLAQSADRDGNRWLTLAGLTAGLAAWTKNEGILFTVVVLAVRFGIAAMRQPWRQVLRDGLQFSAGLIIPLATLIVFKIFLAPPNDLLAPQTAATIFARITDPNRYRLIVSFVGRTLVGFGDWRGGVFILLPVYALFSLGQWRPSAKSQTVSLAAILALVAAGYFGIYLITPYPLEWHLTYSIDRLFMHLYPLALLLILLVTRTPEEIFAARGEGYRSDAAEKRESRGIFTRAN